MDDASVPYGLCECGCGEKTKPAPQNSKRKGWVKGGPMRFVARHYYTYQRNLAAERLVSGVKRCPKCRVEWPATAEYFRPEPRYADGLRSDCRECGRQYAEKRRMETDYAERYRAENKALNAERVFSGEKRQCAVCGDTYPGTPEYFRRDSSKPDGLQGSCRACKAKLDNDWYYAHWKEEREKQRIYQRSYYKTADGILSRRASNLRRRKAVREAGGSVSADEIWQMYESQDALCAYCEEPLFGTFHVEHMQPISKGGRNDWTNVAIACPNCNWRKRDKTTEEFMAVLME